MPTWMTPEYLNTSMDMITMMRWFSMKKEDPGFKSLLPQSRAAYFLYNPLSVSATTAPRIFIPVACWPTRLYRLYRLLQAEGLWRGRGRRARISPASGMT